MTAAHFFPLDHQLHLRDDQWSGGLARVVVRQGLQTRSFEKAAVAVTDAVGRSISKESVRQVTEAFGQHLETLRQDTIRRVAARSATSPTAPEELVAPMDAIAGAANVSTDGGMVLLREEGWKEFKLTTVSAIRELSTTEASQARHARRARHQEARIVLERHSYQAGVWDADTMEHHQYVEGLRRRITQADPLTAVSDAAPWIKRITTTNFPDAERIIDWHHAKQRLQQVNEVAIQTTSVQQSNWLETQLDALWQGETHRVIDALQDLDLAHPAYPDEVQQSPGYFRNHHEYMDYPYYRDAGFPIGSGSVEGGINLMHHRMRRQGPGWKRSTAQGMFAALSALHSGRFDRAWSDTSAVAA